MELRTDTIGHFENPTEDNICDAVAYSGEGAQEGDIVKLMTDEEHFLCIWGPVEQPPKVFVLAMFLHEFNRNRLF